MDEYPEVMRVPFAGGPFIRGCDLSMEQKLRIILGEEIGE